MNKEKLLNRILIILSIAGIFDSLYLLYIKLSHAGEVCTGGCDVVNSSKYSEIFGIPLAIFGALFYLSIIVILLLSKRIEFIKENSIIIIFGISLIGVLYSAYLTYLELAVIHAICQYCVISAILTVGLFIVAIIKLNSEE